MSYIEDLTGLITPELTDLLYIYQNGADFKITNQQLLDLIKTNTVIPLTQAQYDLLTPAEKNNGSIYIITDGTITADDVEYSSGVSVGDKLDELSGKIVKTASANGTLSSTSYGGLFYADITPDVSINRIISAIVISNSGNNWAYCQIVGGGIRVWANNSGGSVSVRYSYI